jgi:undecaprenyl-diphosphatase
MQFVFRSAEESNPDAGGMIKGWRLWGCQLEIMTDKTEEWQREVDRPAVKVTGRAERHRRRVIFEGLVVIALMIFIALTVLASTRAYFQIDLAITQALQSLQARWFASLMGAVSWPGNWPQSVIVTGLLILGIWWAGFKRATVIGGLCAIGVQLLNSLVKISVQRPRPAADLVDVFRELGTFSFPSGHVMFYTGFFGFLLFLVYRLIKDSWKRMALMTIFGGLVALVGLSRVYLGAHWASDVLGGYILGGVWLLLMVEVYRRGQPRSEEGV